MRSLPWEPLFTIERSGIAEVTRSGIVSIVDGDGNVLLAHGDTNFQMWSRSCLKAWQLLSHLAILQQSYPALLPHHYALMASSHNGEDIHVSGVREILAIGDIDTTFLQCPACYPLSEAATQKAVAQKLPTHAIFNNCSGKHSGLLLAMKARGQDLSDYLNPDGPQFMPLKRLLGWLLGKSADEFAVTTDGCRLPNYALSAKQLAKLYVRLNFDFTPAEIESAPDDIKPMLKVWPCIRQYMSKYPQLIGGSGSIDTKIMQGEFVDDKSQSFLAKRGADGMLAISLAPTKKYPRGLGILIKDAGGTPFAYQELMINTVFSKLDLAKPATKDDFNKHLHTTDYLAINQVQLSK